MTWGVFGNFLGFVFFLRPGWVGVGCGRVVKSIHTPLFVVVEIVHKFPLGFGWHDKEGSLFCFGVTYGGLFGCISERDQLGWWGQKMNLTTLGLNMDGWGLRREVRTVTGGGKLFDPFFAMI